jgi:hypothetical protein
MLKIIKNEILKTMMVLLVLVGIGMFTTLVEEPNKNWVYDQVVAHGQMLDIYKDKIEFRVDNEEHKMTWDEAENYFKDLND